jgi:crossover junction endonuclease MUS81
MANINIKLCIDNREASIINLLKDNTDIVYETSNLDIGDIAITVNDIPIVIIERKTFADLSQSITDGRYREQKIRLKETHQNLHAKLVYIIEGKYSKKTFRLGRKTYLSTYLHMLFRDGIPIVNTATYNETVEWILHLYNDIIKHPEIYEQNTDLNDEEDGKELTQTEYLDCLRNQKKSKMTPELCFKQQLSEIPGVSTSIATAIATKYKSFVYLINAFDNYVEDEPSKMLAELEHGLTERKRKIGQSVGQKIYEYVFFE